MSMKKKAIMAASYVMVAALAIGGTVAYLTDRDNATNTFTVGNVDIELNEDFQQGAELIPGVDITKKPTITNAGGADAWVWMTIAVPSKLDELGDGMTNSSENVIHWNPLGATWEGVTNPDRIEKAIAAGHLPEGTTVDSLGDRTWDVNSAVEAYTQEINGVDYNVYTLLYNDILSANEETLPSLTNVYLDKKVDVAPDGQMYLVENGKVTNTGWNIDEDGAPKIYVNAYAMQADGFETVDDAYNAYAEQWADNGAGQYDYFYAATSGTNNLNDTIVLADSSKATDCVTATGEDTVVNITGGFYDSGNKDCAVWAYDGATVNIYDGEFTTGALEGEPSSGNHSDLIYAGANGGKINIYGGTFSTATAGDWILNEKDNQGTIVVYGGTFKNWNPAKNVSEGKDTNFVAEGYHVEEKNDGDDVWYTVVKNK